MKKLAVAAVIALAATSAFAGGMVEPDMDREVLIVDTPSSAGGIIVPIIALLLIAAAVAD